MTKKRNIPTQDSISSRAERKERTRKLILHTATELFLQKDYNCVSVERIAEVAGVAKGTVFHHFKSKDNLAIEVVENLMDSLLQEYDQLVASGMSSAEILRSITETSIKMTIENPGFSHLLVQVVSKHDVHESSSPAPIVKLIKELEEKYMVRLVDLFSRLNLPNPLQAAAIYGAILDGIGFQAMFSVGEINNPSYVQSLVDEVVSLFLCRRDTDE